MIFLVLANWLKNRRSSLTPSLPRHQPTLRVPVDAFERDTRAHQHLVLCSSAHLPSVLLLQRQRRIAAGNGQVKSSYYSPKAKSKNPQQAEQGHAQMQQCL
jgi:hypothetical protein